MTVRSSADRPDLQQRGRQRRNRYAYLALLRRSSEYSLRSSAVRAVAVVVAAIAGTTSRWGWLVALGCAVPALGCYLLWANERHMRLGTRPRFWLSRLYLQNVVRTDGRHRLSLGSYFDLAGSVLLIAAPAWVATDAPVVARLIMLAAGTVFFVSSALLIFNDHTWFNPAELHPPRWHEVSRLLAGPITVGLTCAIALPADWGPRGELAALVIALTPLTVSFRIWDTSVILRHLAPLVQEEAHAGRELVLSETHGALSTNLRLLEQQARAVRDSAPVLYELAVSANSRLRETLALSHPDVVSSTAVSMLTAPVFTLARAVGARAQVDVQVAAMTGPDRDLARLVLADLVGNALNAEATDVTVRIAEHDRFVVIGIVDDAPPMVGDAWRSPGSSSARLAARLAELSGSLEVGQGQDTKTVTARWLRREE